CVTSQTAAAGATVTFSGLTKGVTYYILTTLATGDLTATFATDLCVNNNLGCVHPPTPKNIGGVAGAGGSVNTDNCANAYAITQKQVYITSTYCANADGGASCNSGSNVWFYWNVPSTYPNPGQAFFQMWNKNCTGGPATRGTDLIVAPGTPLNTSNDPCNTAFTCYDFNTPTATAADAGHDDWSTNVGWDPNAYACRYYGTFTGDQNAVCDFNYEINDSPSLQGVIATQDTICQGQTTVISGKNATGYEWSTGETTASITVSPTVTTQYTVTATSGASGYDIAKVTVIPYPFTVTATPGAICTGVTSVTLTATSTSTLTPEYSWVPAASLTPATGASVKAHPTVTTTYTVTAKIGRAGTFPGCIATATTTVTDSPNLPITVNAGVVCPGQSAILTASGADTYTWAPAT